MSVESMGQSDEPEANSQHARVEGESAVKSEPILVDGVELTSVDVEADGVAQEGSANIGLEDTVTVESIVSEVPWVKLSELTKADPTLAIA